MILKNKIPLIQLLFALSFFIIVGSCKKEEKRNPAINWENPANIPYGTPLSNIQLNATADVPGTFVYTPASGTILKEGTNQELKVDFIPADPTNYNLVSKTVKITVDLIIKWENPFDIAFGILLSEKQLNATAVVPGTFTYTPAIGTKLNEGINQELKVEFKPTDAVNYSSVNKTVKINVTPSVADIEGNLYRVVTIGTQTWMVENLKTTKYRNGEPVSYVTNATTWETTTSGAYCWFNNDETNYKNAYGALYNYFTITDNRNIAPLGWHVPNDAEWNTLITYLGGPSVAGGKMKESGILNWTNPNTGATNESGFYAIPCSYRNIYGTFSTGAFQNATYWWASTIPDAVYPWYYFVEYDNANATRKNLGKNNGFSIRCIKGEVIKIDPVINWSNPNSIAYGTLLGSAQLNATANVSGNMVYTPAAGTKLNTGDAQDLNVVFTPNDKINYNTVTKSVKINVIANWVTDVDGNTYKIVTIGSQTWMAENLKTTKYRNGEPVSYVTNTTTWETTTSGAYCWYNNDEVAYKAPYGALYNYYAITDSRNLAPAGWHVPSDAEWNTLITYLGGSSVAGGKMKESGLSHWTTPNTGATNESGFNALPCSYRNVYGTYSTGAFLKSTYWWTTNAFDAANAWYYFVQYDNAAISNNSLGKTNGFSIRCVKD